MNWTSLIAVKSRIAASLPVSVISSPACLVDTLDGARFAAVHPMLAQTHVRSAGRELHGVSGRVSG